ncbi:MAG: cytochrome C oxidase subunit I [Ferrovum sp.]|nr:cytochrome C oxidase subunit I [Ferrovum sp.]
MTQTRFEFEPLAGTQRQLAIGWMLLALGALVLGGVLTILIVLSRTPVVQDIIPWADFFHTAIIVHVDLTVLVWFLACAGVFWSLNSNQRGNWLGWLALGLCVLGAIVFTAAPFVGAGEPLMNNYIPILLDRIFLGGLGLVGIGFSLMVLRSLISIKSIGGWNSGAGVMRFGINTALTTAVCALMCVAASYYLMPDFDQARDGFELLFWGGGHVLQITHTQLMVVAWLGLATAAGISLNLAPRVAWIILALGFVPVLAVPALYSSFDVNATDHLIGFTRFMEYSGGIAALPIGLIVTIGAIRTRGCRFTPELAALLASIALFAFGGIIGFLIRGTNVTIPAHYHGSIIGVTIAFMGVVYHLLPKLGFRAPMMNLARWQPIVYGGGQSLHVIGLAWAGGYGVQRKTAGIAQGLHSIQEIAAMGIMGVGGLASVTGGLLFLVVAITAIWPASHKQVH